LSPKDFVAQDLLDTDAGGCVICPDPENPFPPCGPVRLGVSAMTWESPTFVEVKMDAEINSYQEDGGDGDF